ncbi:uncharacterized protein LOC112600474 [Melanaphis sacchari]|uniref:uncharacterized protein LOC112600474 n=1 Tax=Melanaphis sacchari TaxID=742174 RepID=UPI000DC148D3|nr:uncharacterized protein LOC112600474 [Melanaphis sacchari]
MMENQRATSSSTFQSQQFAQEPIETLLFNNIIKEKSLILSDLMNQFLQFYPFSRFEYEFNLFTRRIKHIIRDGQCNGTNFVRQTMHILSSNTASTEDFGSQENNLQYIEQPNFFQRPMTNDQLNNIPYTTSNLYDTVIEESIVNNGSVQKYTQQSKFLPPTMSIPYYESLQIDNAPLTTNNNANADIAMNTDSELQLLQAIASITPSNSDNFRTSQLQDQFNCSEKSKVKCLTKWSVNLKQIKSNKNNLKSVIALTGTLLAEDQIRILKKVHEAGILVARKTKNIVKTDKGFYHLIGPITEGSPFDLFRACAEINGIPKTWRNILTHLLAEVKVNHNESMTRKDTVYSKEKKVSQNYSGTGDIVENDILIDNDLRQQLTHLSTSGTIKSFGVCHTPSQILKYKFHKKFVKACLLVGSQENIDDL